MEKLTILIPQIKFPNSKDTIICQFKNILFELQKTFDLEIIWVVFQNERFKRFSKNNSIIVDFHEFSDGVKILEEFKPDLVLLEVRLSINSIIFTKAAKYMQIPTITISPTGWSETFSFFFTLKSNLQLFSLNKVVANDKNINKKFLGMFQYSLKRYFFLLRTIKKTNNSLIKFIYFYPANHIFSRMFPALNKITEGDLNICFNEHWKKRLVDQNFIEKNICLEGDPIFDKFFNKLYFNTKIISKNNKTNILLCPTPMHELGWMTLKQEENLILQIIDYVKKSSNFELSIKIHPSSSSLSEFEHIVSKSNQNIPIFQKEDTSELILNNDVILVYGSSTVILDIVLAKKPLILLNILKTKFIRLFDNELMFQCDDLSKLNHMIDSCKYFKPNQKNYQDYIQKQIGKFDGKSSTRIANLIIMFLKNHSK